MTIHPRPEQEQMIQDALRAGLIDRPEDALEVGLGSLRKRLTIAEVPAEEHVASARNLADVFDSVRGLADDLQFDRNPSTGRPLEL